MASRPKAPGWRWLLAHELRLGWRGGRGRVVVLAVLVAILWAFMHVAGWFLMRDPAKMLQGMGIVTAGIFTWFAVLLLLATTFALAIVVLFDRGDFDLLLASPIPVRTVFLVRGLGVASQAVGMLAILWLPFANAAILHGHLRLAAGYPVLAAFSLGATGVAFAATLALVRAYGVRRAKTIAQVLGAIAGAAIFLATQLFNLLPQQLQREAFAWMRTDDAQQWIGPASPLWWPVRALRRIAALPRRDGRGRGRVPARDGAHRAALPRGHARGRRRARRWRAPRRARSRLPQRPHAGGDRRRSCGSSGAIPSSSRRRCCRSCISCRSSSSACAAARSRRSWRPTIVLIASTLAGNLAWMTVSGEEAPELVDSAPVPRERVLWLKVAAALIVPLAVCAPFLVFYAMQSLAALAAFVACLVGALGSCAFVQVWNARPGSGRDLKAPRGEQARSHDVFSAPAWLGRASRWLGGSSFSSSPWFPGAPAPPVSWGCRRGPREKARR